MNLNDIFDRLWGMDGTHPFGDPFNLEKLLAEDNDLEEEVCEFVKGNFKTIITCRFNKEGFMVGHTVVTESLVDPTEDLKKQLKDAVENEDYQKAADLKKRINGLVSKQGE